MTNYINHPHLSTILSEKKDSPSSYKRKFSTRSHKDIFNHIIYRSNLKGYCWESNKEIAQSVDCSESTVKRALREFIKKDYLLSHGWITPGGKVRHLIPKENSFIYWVTYFDGHKKRQKSAKTFIEKFLKPLGLEHQNDPICKGQNVPMHLKNNNNTTLKSSLNRYGTQKPLKEKTDFSKKSFNIDSSEKKPPPPPDPKPNFPTKEKKPFRPMKKNEVSGRFRKIIEREVEMKMERHGKIVRNPQAYESTIRGEKYWLLKTRRKDLQDSEVLLLQKDYQENAEWIYSKNGNHRVRHFCSEEEWEKFIKELKRFGKAKREILEREKIYDEKKEQERQKYLLQCSGGEK